MENFKQSKIFLVDDDSYNLMLCQHLLQQQGYTDISTFENGTECLNNLVNKPQVIFLDHNMNDLSGFEVLKKIKRFNPNIFVVMLSGQESMMTAVDSLKYGAFDYIMKGDDAPKRIINVLQRIAQIQETASKSTPTVWKKIASFL